MRRGAAQLQRLASVVAEHTSSGLAKIFRLTGLVGSWVRSSGLLWVLRDSVLLTGARLWQGQIVPQRMLDQRMCPVSSDNRNTESWKSTANIVYPEILPRSPGRSLAGTGLRFSEESCSEKELPSICQRPTLKGEILV